MNGTNVLTEDAISVQLQYLVMKRVVSSETSRKRDTTDVGDLANCAGMNAHETFGIIPGTTQRFRCATSGHK